MHQRKREEFGQERLCALLEDCGGMDLDATKRCLLEALRRHAGQTPYEDDLTLLLIESLPTMFPIRPAVTAEERRLRDRREQIDGGSNEPTIHILQRPRHTFGPVLSRTLPTGRFPEPCSGEKLRHAGCGGEDMISVSGEELGLPMIKRMLFGFLSGMRLREDGANIESHELH